MIAIKNKNKTKHQPKVTGMTILITQYTLSQEVPQVIKEAYVIVIKGYDMKLSS